MWIYHYEIVVSIHKALVQHHAGRWLVGTHISILQTWISISMLKYLLRAYDGTCGDVGHVKQYWGKEEEKKPNMLSK